MSLVDVAFPVSSSRLTTFPSKRSLSSIGSPSNLPKQLKEKVAYQEKKIDASNCKHLKKMATAHIDIAKAAKKQQMALASAMSSQHSTLKHLAYEAIMNKDLTGAYDDVKKYSKLQQK
ncbi:hypothetical protein PGT21_034794 [Puccinia graminis f. sp. tritici]|uniref:No apical meristem-associated C-terminal domain-containing protein n=1 Tax=Puccinia graminis f. sp. tritici TaxID=56615 RepID=A0A5B0MFK2_PUCGR|nr:hypothetical protein PGT21_034794 [Puccinia graminis f. sp. tritici]